MNGFKNFFVESFSFGHNVYIDDRIVQLYRSGNKLTRIEEETGKRRTYIYDVLKKEGIFPNRLNQQRELTIQLAGSGVSAKKIAEITQQTERNIRKTIQRHDRKQNNHGLLDSDH